jgi:hypothetical protein
MRWAELALFLAPFALYAAWRIAAAQARPAILWGAVAALLLVVTATVWTGVTGRLSRDDAYVPAQWEHGAIVPGHGARPPVR